MDGTDLSVKNLTFADLYQTSNGVGASGLMGLGFPLNGNIWSVSHSYPFLLFCFCFCFWVSPSRIEGRDSEVAGNRDFEEGEYEIVREDEFADEHCNCIL